MLFNSFNINQILLRRLNKGPLKSSSLLMCMKLNEVDPGLKLSDPVPHSSDIWEFSDLESPPASSWSTLPNRALLSRPLPLDEGRCTCIIAKETVERERGISVYSLYTNVSFWYTVGVYLYQLKETVPMRRGCFILPFIRGHINLTNSYNFHSLSGPANVICIN